MGCEIKQKGGSSFFPLCSSSLQITVIGRYGSTNARAKIPLGFYYGHTYILPWESELKLMNDPLRAEGDTFSQPELEQHLAMMVALQEDIQCRLVPEHTGCGIRRCIILCIRSPLYLE